MECKSPPIQVMGGGKAAQLSCREALFVIFIHIHVHFFRCNTRAEPCTLPTLSYQAQSLLLECLLCESSSSLSLKVIWVKNLPQSSIFSQCLSSLAQEPWIISACTEFKVQTPNHPAIKVYRLQIILSNHSHTQLVSGSTRIIFHYLTFATFLPSGPSVTTSDHAVISRRLCAFLGAWSCLLACVSYQCSCHHLCFKHFISFLFKTNLDTDVSYKDEK